jgi:hypothetical protein
MNFRPKTLGLHFCGNVVYRSGPFLGVIGYEADIVT